MPEPAPQLPAPGEPFNPVGFFTGLFLPDVLARTAKLSDGAKLTWAWMVRYSFPDGVYRRGHVFLAACLNCVLRSVNNYIRELEAWPLIRGRRPGVGQPIRYEFLWHAALADSLRRLPDADEGQIDGEALQANFADLDKQTLPGRPAKFAGETSKVCRVDRKNLSGMETAPNSGLSSHLEPKSSPVYKGSSIRVTIDDDDDDADRRPILTDGDEKSRGVAEPAPDPEYHALMREALAVYMRPRLGPPDEDLVRRAIAAANGAPMEEVLEYLRRLYTRGRSPADPGGPRSYGWFPKMLKQRFGCPPPEAA
jgi:hypothetical protein